MILFDSFKHFRDIFLRELISNANDALEKLRIVSLTNKDIVLDSSLNITIKALKEADGSGGRIIITGKSLFFHVLDNCTLVLDYGIGMSPEELSTNLGTLAKSGTSEFLARAESGVDGTGQGNLIGAFGMRTNYIIFGCSSGSCLFSMIRPGFLQFFSCCGSRIRRVCPRSSWEECRPPAIYL